MANTRDLDLTQWKELQQRLEQLPGKIARKVMRGAVAKSTTPINKRVKQLAPVKDKNLRRSIGKKNKTYKGQVFVSMIGPRVGFRTSGPDGRIADPANYAHLVEFGTAPHAQPGLAGKRMLLNGRWFTHSGHHPGTPPRSFMRRGFNDTKSEALSILKTEIGTGIEREAAKRA